MSKTFKLILDIVSAVIVLVTAIFIFVSLTSKNWIANHRVEILPSCIMTKQEQDILNQD